VLIENENIENHSNPLLSKLLANKIGMIFHNFSLLPSYSVFENIDIALNTGGNHMEKLIYVWNKPLHSIRNFQWYFKTYEYEK
jgi:ABC-type lipoprotein export system ATPase subunit